MDSHRSIQGKIISDLIERFSEDLLSTKRSKNGDLRRRMVRLEPEWVSPSGYTLIHINGRNCSMELLQHQSKNQSRIVLQLHGGGYIGGMKNIYRDFAHMYSQLGKGISVLTPDYRLAPEHPFPAALEDAIYAYHWLMDSGWKSRQIIVAGDSAGGGLALALCHALKQEKTDLPGGLICMSPWTDMTASGPSYGENYHRDVLFGNAEESMLTNRDYMGAAEPTNPLLSPLFGDFSGFPPTLIQAGSYEMLLSDAVGVAEKEKKLGVRVRLTIYEGMFHVFQMGLQRMPESRRAWNEVGRFLEIMQKS